jgi:CRISPR/Cas system-associated protein Csm6
MKFFIVILALLTGVVAAAQDVPLTVISNQKGAPATLKQAELRSILKGEQQRWRNGSKIIIALMKTNTPVGKYTSEKVYDMSTDELKKYWLALVFQGKADAPVFFNSISELLTFVAENPGAIGIVDQTAPVASTQVVLVDGKASF